MAQKTYKFRANSLDEAYRQMRKTLGPDAIILATRQVPVAGLWGYLGRHYVEVSATLNAPTPKSAAPAAAPAPAPIAAPNIRRQSPAERRYAENMPLPAGNLAENPDVAYYEQLMVEAQKRLAVRNTPNAAPPTTGHGAVVPFPQQKSEDPAAIDALITQMDDMREMLQVLVAETPGAGLAPHYAPHYRMLIENGVSRTLAAALLAASAHASDDEVLRDPLVFRERLKVEIRKRVQVSGGYATVKGASRLVALVGATGVGKTTSLAKLAARYALKQGAKVALITADTYRVAATDQLLKYANIIGVPMRVIHDAREMADARRAFAGYDLVFMDTAGGSQFNTKQIQELKLLLTAAQPDAVSLVLSATTQVEDLRSIAANFGCLKPNSILFTKLDETRRFGGLLTLLSELNLPLGYLSIGQNVPDDLVLAHPGMMANLVLEGRENRGRPSSASA